MKKNKKDLTTLKRNILFIVVILGVTSILLLGLFLFSFTIYIVHGEWGAILELGKYPYILLLMVGLVVGLPFAGKRLK